MPSICCYLIATEYPREPQGDKRLRLLDDAESPKLEKVVKKIDEVLVDIDDNVLQYCNIDKQVRPLLRVSILPTPVQIHRPGPCSPQYSSPIVHSGAGQEAKGQAESGTEGAGISGCNEGEFAISGELRLLSWEQITSCAE